MRTQEDGYIEVTTNLFNRTPILKWVRPVFIKRLRLLFDTYSLMIVSRESGLDFSDMDNMDMEEYLAWMVWGGYKSHQATIDKKPRGSVEDAVRWVRGILIEDRKEIQETIKMSKEIGMIAESYQKARNNPEGEAEGEKKDQVSEQPS